MPGQTPENSEEPTNRMDERDEPSQVDESSQAAETSDVSEESKQQDWPSAEVAEASEHETQWPTHDPSDQTAESAPEWPTVEPEHGQGSTAAAAQATGETEDSAAQESPTDVIYPAEHETPSQNAAEVTAETPVTSEAHNSAVDDQPTASIPTVTGASDAEPATDPHLSRVPSWQQRRTLVRSGIVAACVVAVLGLCYLADLLISGGSVFRGTEVAGVRIGGMDKAAAERKLHAELEPRLNQPVQLVAGDAQATIAPQDAGLSMDIPATVREAGETPLNPITRITSLFTTHEVEPVTTVDQERLAGAMKQVQPVLEQPPVEGTIRFEGAMPIPVDPQSGRTLNVPTALEQIQHEWANRHPLQLPHTMHPVRTTPEGVRKTLNDFVKPAVSSDVAVHGDGKDATLSPEAIANSLRFSPNGAGGLKVDIDKKAAIDAVRGQLADTEQPAADAKVVLQGGAPTVQPSTDGRVIDWEKSFANLRDVLAGSGQGRFVKAQYVHQPAKFDTEAANKLGIREVIGEFTTTDFATDSGVNIRQVAAQVDGALVKPNEVFSLNGHTGPRGKAQGYVEAGVIEDGRAKRDVGGGISQFATTLYNASYFAGMTNVEHQEHSYYISRYPPGREATVFQSPNGSSVIDVKFRNNDQTGVLIETQWTPSSITVRLWGTKHHDVRSETGPKTDFTPPNPIVVPPGEPCKASQGAPGFTVVDTRVMTDLETGAVQRQPRKVVYDPQPKVECAPGPHPPQ